jgi:hypothetical protein
MDLLKPFQEPRLGICGFRWSGHPSYLSLEVTGPSEALARQGRCSVPGTRAEALLYLQGQERARAALWPAVTETLQKEIQLIPRGGGVVHMTGSPEFYSKLPQASETLQTMCWLINGHPQALPEYFLHFLNTCLSCNQGTVCVGVGQWGTYL